MYRNSAERIACAAASKLSGDWQRGKGAQAKIISPEAASSSQGWVESCAQLSTRAGQGVVLLPCFASTPLPLVLVVFLFRVVVLLLFPCTVVVPPYRTEQLPAKLTLLVVPRRLAYEHGVARGPRALRNNT